MTLSTGSTAASLRCESCRYLPEPGKVQLTVANVANALPIELAVPALVIQTLLRYPLKVLILALTTATLVIWVCRAVRDGIPSWLTARPSPRF